MNTFHLSLALSLAVCAVLFIESYQPVKNRFSEKTAFPLGVIGFGLFVGAIFYTIVGLIFMEFSW